MAVYTIQNDTLSASIDTHGAELKSLRKGEQEYLWQADPAFWGRTSPVLFPLVGNFTDKRYAYQAKLYSMSQHGFARDQDFMLLSQQEHALWFRLTENAATLEIYPFSFILDIGYILHGNELKVCWKVTNSGNATLFFSIGGHPAFLCPLDASQHQTDCFLHFKNADHITYGLLNSQGCYTDMRETLKLTDSTYQITEDLFQRDALIIENNQCSEVSILGFDKRPYVTVQFSSPLFGIWSPTGKHAPFVCIEPWYGRSDHEDFDGSLEEREYGNFLEPNAVFEEGYKIIVE